MNLEDQPQTVKLGTELTLSQATKDKDSVIKIKECQCSENTTCEYCCIQEYKKAWRVLQQQPLILSRTGGTICHSENAVKEKETIDYPEDSDCDRPTQGDTELDGACDTNFQPNSDKPKVNWDTEFRYNDVEDYIDSDSEETKEADFSNDLEQLNESWEDTTKNDSDCPSEATTRETAEAVTDETNIYCHEVQDASREIEQMDSDTDTCLSEVTKELERSNENCDTSVDNYSSSTKGTLSETPNAEVFTDSVGESCKRTRRNSKRKRDLEDSCPICGLTIRSCELQTHFQKEVENLSKVHKNLRRVRVGGTGVNTTFVQVKCNRENRHAAKVAKYTKKPAGQVQCPVCWIKLNGSEDEINDHVLNCSEEDNLSDINILDRDDSFEEYEFGDETRVRAISLVPGGYKALHGHCSVSKSTEDDEDLNVDVDDTLKYGKPQYTELDVIHNLTDAAEVKQLEQLRKAVIDPTAEPNILESRKWTNSTDEELEKSEENNILEDVHAEDTKSEHLVTKSENPVQNTIILSLKEKIKNLEDQSKSVKCLICLEPYTKPVVSTACWHVYCEECWLMTMGVKKLCPQCNMIVFPSDLRRIYL